MGQSFNVLFLLAAVATLIALARLRIGLFFIAINQAIALRALDGIVVYGQPRSQWFLPQALFSQSQLELTSGIFWISVPLTLLFVLLPGGAHDDGTAQQWPPLPKWVLWLAGIYFAVLVVSVRTIFTGAYASEGQLVFHAPSGGVQAMMTSAVIYELYRRVRVGAVSAPRAFLYLSGLLFLTDFSKGTTGFATSFLLCGTALFFSTRSGIRRRLLPLVAAVALVATTAMIVRTVRQSLHESGTSAVTAAARTIESSETRRAETGEGLEDRMNGAQIAAHTLECVWLYENGRGREWRSIYNPLIYTFQPAFLVKWLGLQRPKEAAWELGDYFIHGGGVFSFGEMYWNGGYLCVFLVSLALLALTWFIDTHRSRSIWALLFACMFTPSLLQGMQYGLSYPARGLSNAVLAVILFTPLVHGWQSRRRKAGLDLLPSVLPREQST